MIAHNGNGNDNRVTLIPIDAMFCVNPPDPNDRDASSFIQCLVRWSPPALVNCGGQALRPCVCTTRGAKTCRRPRTCHLLLEAANAIALGLARIAVLPFPLLALHPQCTGSAGSVGSTMVGHATSLACHVCGGPHWDGRAAQAGAWVYLGDIQIGVPPSMLPFSTLGDISGSVLRASLDHIYALKLRDELSTSLMISTILQEYLQNLQ